MLADATRVRIILALRDNEELSVNHLADIVEKSPPRYRNIWRSSAWRGSSPHVRTGQRVFYRLDNEHARQLVSDAIFQAEHSLGGTPRHHHNQAEGVA